MRDVSRERRHVNLQRKIFNHRICMSHRQFEKMVDEPACLGAGGGVNKPRFDRWQPHNTTSASNVQSTEIGSAAITVDEVLISSQGQAGLTRRCCEGLSISRTMTL